MCLIAFSSTSFSASLIIKKNGKLLKIVELSDYKKIELPVYNAWRKYQKTYVGYDFYNLLDSVYGTKWRTKNTIIFSAIDGYNIGGSISDMLKASQGKKGLLAIKEKGGTGFTPLKKGDKMINFAPIYLVWSGFRKTETASHSDALKWPFQMVSVDIKD